MLACREAICISKKEELIASGGVHPRHSQPKETAAFRTHPAPLSLKQTQVCVLCGPFCATLHSKDSSSSL